MVIDAAALLHDVIWALRVEWLQCPMKNLPLVHSTDVAAGLLCFSGFQLHAIAPTSQPNFRNLRKDNTKSVNLEEGGLLKVSKVPKVSPY
jgi:hypothetical protein